jgi:hypothetical protein
MGRRGDDAPAGRLALHTTPAARPGDQRAHGAVAGAALRVEQLQDIRPARGARRRHGIVAGRGRLGLTIEPSHRSSVA